MQADSEQRTKPQTDPTDCELLQQFIEGDRSAFAKLVRRWEAPLGRIAYRIVGDVAAAEDVQQIVFLRLLESYETLQNKNQVAAWLRRCTVNVAITELRRRNRHPRTGESMVGNWTALVSSDPSAALTASEETTRLQKALACLDCDQRALLSLRFDESLTFREIATIVGRPVSTVKSQVRTAIGRLRALLTASQQGSGCDHECR